MKASTLACSNPLATIAPAASDTAQAWRISSSPWPFARIWNSTASWSSCNGDTASPNTTMAKSTWVRAAPWRATHRPPARAADRSGRRARRPGAAFGSRWRRHRPRARRNPGVRACERPVPRLSYTNAPTPAAGNNRCIQSQSSAESISEPCTSTTMGTLALARRQDQSPDQARAAAAGEKSIRASTARCGAPACRRIRGGRSHGTRRGSIGFPGPAASAGPRVVLPRASSPLAPSMRRQRSVSAREGAMSSGVPSASSAYAPTRQSAASAGRIIAHSAAPDSPAGRARPSRPDSTSIPASRSSFLLHPRRRIRRLLQGIRRRRIRLREKTRDGRVTCVQPRAAATAAFIAAITFA